MHLDLGTDQISPNVFLLPASGSCLFLGLHTKIVSSFLFPWDLFLFGYTKLGHGGDQKWAGKIVLLVLYFLRAHIDFAFLLLHFTSVFLPTSPSSRMRFWLHPESLRTCRSLCRNCYSGLFVGISISCISIFLILAACSREDEFFGWACF